MDRLLVEEFGEDLQGLRDQATAVQHLVVNMMILSEDDEIHEVADSLGDLLDEVKSRVDLLTNRLWRG